MWVYIPWQQFATQWPCPSGFHVPLRSEWITLKDIFTWLWLSLGGDFIAYFKLPPAWRRASTSGDVAQQNSQCRYWGSEKSILNNNYATWLNINWNTISAGSSPYRAYGCSIRAFSNTSVIPDSNWSVLHQWTWTAWIYHNSSLWLISASSDWTTWVTIADKNLWATEVYNYLDNLSENNCGWYFQWWNNYMFPFSWSVTTSSTKVDTTNYWPNNYYNSSTFITASSSPYNWSSVLNQNLWWWEDGNVNVLRMEELKNAYIWELLPTSITLDKSSISLTTIWQTEQLTATVEPEDAPRKTVTWSSDDTTVATVSTTGLVTCVTPWTCTITATTVNGLTASCEVSGWWAPWANTLFYWSFDAQSLADDSWNNRDGTWYNSSAGTYTTWIKSYWVDMLSTKAINMPIPCPSWNFTYSICVKLNSLTKDFQTLMWTAEWVTNVIHYMITPSWITFNFWWVMTISTGVTPTVGSWANIVATRSSNTWTIYMNWTQIWQSTYSWTPAQNYQRYVGKWYTNDRYIDWVIDEVIFENVAWTSQEISDYVSWLWIS